MPAVRPARRHRESRPVAVQKQRASEVGFHEGEFSLKTSPINVVANSEGESVKTIATDWDRAKISAKSYRKHFDHAVRRDHAEME